MNYIGIREGVWVQRVFTLLKIAGILLLIGSAFRLRPISESVETSLGPGVSLSHFGAAMVACLMAYNGWTYISFIAGEVRNPERTLPRALTLAMAIVVAIYLLANSAYLRLLPVHEIAVSERVGARLAIRTLGSGGGDVLSIIVLFRLLEP